MGKSCRAHRDEDADAERGRQRLPVATKTVVVRGSHRFSPSSSLRGMRRYLATPITSHQVVDTTMNGEGDVSHHLSEYFGSCRNGVGPGALAPVSWLKSERATRYRLVGWRVAEAPRRFPPPSVGLCPRRRLATCCLRCWERGWEGNWEKSMA